MPATVACLPDSQPIKLRASGAVEFSMLRFSLARLGGSTVTAQPGAPAGKVGSWLRLCSAGSCIWVEGHLLGD